MSESSCRPLLTLRECAELLGIKYGAIRKDVERRGLKPTLPGRRGRAALYDPEAVRIWRLDRTAGKIADVCTAPVDPLAHVTSRAARIPDLIAYCAISATKRAGANRAIVAEAAVEIAIMATEYIFDELADVLPGLTKTPTLKAELSQLREIAGAIKKP